MVNFGAMGKLAGEKGVRLSGTELRITISPRFLAAAIHRDDRRLPGRALLHDPALKSF